MGLHAKSRQSRHDLLHGTIEVTADARSCQQPPQGGRSDIGKTAVAASSGDGETVAQQSTEPQRRQLRPCTGPGEMAAHGRHVRERLIDIKNDDCGHAV